jgi:hypothetical protein
MYKKIGTIQVFDDLTLKDFTWKLGDYTARPGSGYANIEVLMWENLYVHSRFYPNVFENVNYTDADVFAYILSLDQFADSEAL